MTNQRKQEIAAKVRARFSEQQKPDQPTQPAATAAAPSILVISRRARQLSQLLDDVLGTAGEPQPQQPAQPAQPASQPLPPARRPAIFITLVDDEYVWFRSVDDPTAYCLPVLLFIQRFGEHKLVSAPGMLIAPTVVRC